MQPLRRALPRSVAIFRNRHPLDILHDEIGPAGVGLAAVEHLGNVRVIHHCQRLPLRLEAGQDTLRVHARLNQLERHFAFDRLSLLSDPDRAHAAFAIGFKELVASVDHLADQAGFGVIGGKRLTRFRDRLSDPRLVQQRIGSNVCVEKLLKPRPPIRISGTLLIQQRGPLFRVRDGQGSRKQIQFVHDLSIALRSSSVFRCRKAQPCKENLSRFLQFDGEPGTGISPPGVCRAS
jgi:hypothetical protein